jgi:hypothetical protein
MFWLVSDAAFGRGVGLTIQTFGGFELAYRKATADEVVLAHSFDPAKAG